MLITKEQESLIVKLIDRLEEGRGIMGRPRRATPQVVHGILWVLNTGAPWHAMPRDENFAPYQTCHRRFQELTKSGVWQKMMERIAIELQQLGKLDNEEGFVDGSFSKAKKGATELVRQKSAREQKSWLLQMLPAFRSPLMWKALAPTKLSFFKKSSTPVCLDVPQKN